MGKLQWLNHTGKTSSSKKADAELFSETYSSPKPILTHWKALAWNENYYKKLIEKAEAEYTQNGVHSLSSPAYQSGLSMELGDNILIDLGNFPHERIQPLPDEIINQMKLRNTECRLWMRPEVYSSLITLTENLPKNWGVYIFEGYRTPQDQKERFLKYKNAMIAKARAENSLKSDEEIEKELEKIMCPVKDNITPPHTTGGAVELIPFDLESKELLPMGFNFADWTKTICPSFYKGDGITVEVKKNREILLEAATKAGFINFPGEFWQFNLGNIVWSFHTGRPIVYNSLTAEQARNCLSPLTLNDLSPMLESEGSLEFN